MPDSHSRFESTLLPFRRLMLLMDIVCPVAKQCSPSGCVKVQVFLEPDTEGLLGLPNVHVG